MLKHHRQVGWADRYSTLSYFVKTPEDFISQCEEILQINSYLQIMSRSNCCLVIVSLNMGVNNMKYAENRMHIPYSMYLLENHAGFYERLADVDS